MRQGKEVDPSQANDTSLLYGKISSTYAPLFAESVEWGSASKEQKADFTEEMNKFMRNLSSAVDSLVSSLELRQIFAKHMESFELDLLDKKHPNP